MDEQLESLTWHWGDAYQIVRPEPDLWIAVRRDTHATLRADGPEELRDLIREDYCAKPVPRSTACQASG